MKHNLLIASVIVLCIPGCGPTARTQSSPDRDESPVSHVPEKSTQPEKSTAQTTAAATGLVKPYFPQPISTEDEAQACLAAARELDERIKRLTGVPSHDVTKRLTDCIVRYDADKTGYTKFYPGKTRIRSFRDREIADVNVSVPEHDGRAPCENRRDNHGHLLH